MNNNNNDINSNVNNVVSPNNVGNVVYPNTTVNNNQNNGMIDPSSINSVVNGPNSIPTVNVNTTNTYSVPEQNTNNLGKTSFIEKFREKLNNLGKTKAFKIIVVVIIILIVLFLLFKLFLVTLFNKIPTYPKFIIDYDSRTSFSISTNEYDLGDEDYIHFNNIKFVDYLDDSFVSKEIKSSNGDEGILYESSNWNSSLEISSNYTYMDVFINESKEYATGINAILSGTSSSRKKYLEKNDIDSDIELFGLMNKHIDTKVSFSSSISEIMVIGSLKLFASSYLPEADEIMILAGDYDGYILVKDNERNINVEYNKKRYVIELNGNFFYDDMLQEIMNTLELQ